MEPSVPKSTQRQVETLPEEILHDVEDFFKPRDGGMIAQHRAERARREAALEEARNTEERVESAAFMTVKTATVSPEVISAQTLVVGSASQPVMLLPNSPYRSRATILVTTTGGSLVLSSNTGNALGQVGFTLPAGIPLTLNTRAQLYAYNASGSPVTVSVISEIYAPEG